ncbi:MAG TPA: SHOCT domain-containing protein [Longimicrobium sp.]|nr:SHOCT domain-containing protein [Longimicrobium sp.]
MALGAARDGSGSTAGRGGVMSFFLVGGIAFAALGVFLLLSGSEVGGTVGLTFTSIGVIWTLVALGLRGFYRGMHRRAQAEQQLFETGRRAVAVVEGVETTGMVLNNVNQQIVLQLRVQPPGEPEFAHRRRMFVPFHGIPRTGDLIDVAYDPADPSKVALATDWRSNTGGGRLLLFRRPDHADETAAGAQPRRDPVLDQLERLDRLRQSGTLTYAEFEAQKARILAGGDA